MYYHYTNVGALFDIIRGGKVWLSSLAFMNDEMEGFDLHKVLAEVLKLKYGSEECEHALFLIDNTIDTNLRFQMSFSASTLKDDISQWRAYTQLGQGICIEFEDGFIPQDSANQVECLYNFADKKSAIIADRNLKTNDEAMYDLLKTPEGVDSYVSSIIKTLVRFKNSSFSPEKEVRWVLHLNGVSDPKAQLKYRPHRLGLSTYQEQRVDLSKLLSITIGPQVPKQNLKTIEDFLIINKASGYVTKSKVTLR